MPSENIDQPSYESCFDIHKTPDNHDQAYYSVGLRERFLIDSLKTQQGKPTEDYADISYDFDEAKYKIRVASRVAAGGLEQNVPPNWPAQVRGPLCWEPHDMKEDDYVFHLTDEHKVEIGNALVHFKDQGLDGSEVSRETFPLHKLSEMLGAVRKDVYEGKGFDIIRGLDPEAWSLEDLTIIYLGLSSYIGETLGKQDQRGSMILHVTRHGNKKDMEYCANKPFHTDTVTDVICLFVRNLAARGGCSIVAPAWKVYNEIAATRPDLIHTLSRPDWPFDTHDRIPAYIKRPVLFFHKGKIIFSFSRRLLVGHPPDDPRTEGIPGLSEAQAEALDAIHHIARQYALRPPMVKGDLRFINNMGLLHCRDAYEDDKDSPRHLIRLWLHNETMCWKLPRPLRLAWARVFDDNERGEHFDIEPPRKDGIILRVAGSCD